MTDDIAIRVRGLGKKYSIGGPQEQYYTLRDAIVNSVKAPFKQFHSSPPSEVFWALKDVSFDVEHGEVVGIIGRNGAGKSTLLKILSRITTPTEGMAELHGRVGSLLEIGTGFHPEMTGRENIFLSGSILGMRKREIEEKFDDIVKFAEIDKFIDTPAKRYSSGMYVRLAFAVAAHMDTEILLVDEVLAVGDVSFQKKCMGKMGDVAKEGRTVLYVSHNMPSVMNLCSRVILLREGRIQIEGTPDEVIPQYLMNESQQGSVVWDTPKDAPGNHIVRLHSVKVIQQGNDYPTSDVLISKDIYIEIQYWNLLEHSRLYTAIWLKSSTGVFVFASSNTKYVTLTEDMWCEKPHPSGLFKSTITIPGNLLNSGHYYVTAIMGTAYYNTQILEENVVSFEVHDDGEMTKESFSSWTGPVIRPKLAWQTHLISKTDKTVME